MHMVIGSKGGDVLAPRPTDQGPLRYGAPIEVANPSLIATPKLKGLDAEA